MKELKAILEWGHERGRQVTGKKQEKQERTVADTFKGRACHMADGRSQWQMTYLDGIHAAMAGTNTEGLR